MSTGEATTLDPQLLRACAAVLAHPAAYAGISRADIIEALRPAAQTPLWGDDMIGDDTADAEREFVSAHFESMVAYAIVGVGLARAILDADEHLLDFWCTRLGSLV